MLGPAAELLMFVAVSVLLMFGPAANFVSSPKKFGQPIFLGSLKSSAPKKFGQLIIIYQKERTYLIIEQQRILQ